MKPTTMKLKLSRRVLALAIASAAAAPAHAAESATLPEVTVIGAGVYTPLQVYDLPLDTGETAAARDSAALLETAPGAAVVRNGQQTGIVQLRGLFGDRVNVSVDGMHITPACPNHMDPPLHYLSARSLAELQVIAGITPVSQGGDSIGGTVIAKSVAPRFGEAAAFTNFGRLGAGYNGSNTGRDEYVQVGGANDRFSAGYAAEHQRGGNLQFPGGEVADTGYTLNNQDLTLATKTGAGVWRLDAGKHKTADAGTPALPMDMIRDDADTFALGYQGDAGFGVLEAKIYRHRIEHLMDNYSLRPAGMSRMFAPATSDDSGASLATSIARGDSVLRFGAELLRNAFDSYSQNAVSGLRQDIIRDASRDRLGVYGEWQASLGQSWQTLAGLRQDTVRSDAADIVNRGMAPLSDQTSFNSRDHDFTDHNRDATLLARYRASPRADYEIGLARKTRSPNLVERYLWTPANASAGQADGRTYLGNLDLKPEVSHQLSLGAVWHGAAWRIAPSLFYNRVSDYIQGAPIARLDTSGNPVLQYTNLGRADLHGVDGRWRYRWSDALGLRGTLSYVRGENRDNGDNLYRLAPLRGDVNLDYRRGTWNHTVEWRLAARQDKVAAYNGETPTGGYGLVNLRTRWQVSKTASLSAGVENLFDKSYADHLGGINRVSGGDVALGAPIPGAGRFLYLAGEYGW
jgi:iron complex outermembrane receptor protein